MQNKLHYAAYGSTTDEVIVIRADAGKPFMGLLAFSAGGVNKKDVSIAKNYLSAEELKLLNNIVSAYFDIAEVRAMNRKPMRMKDWIGQLDRLIEAFDGKVLQNTGQMSHRQAAEKAEGEYRKYQSQILSAVERAYMESIATIEKQAEKGIKAQRSKQKRQQGQNR